MKVRQMLLFLIIVVLLCPFSFAEDAIDYKTYTVRNGSRSIDFSYPSYCSIEDEDVLGVIVRMDASNYIAISIPKRNKSGTEKLHDNIGDAEEIFKLSENIHVSAVHGDENHYAPNTDIVEVGMNLENGTGAIINITCPFGQTDIYEIATVIINSITTEDVFEKWLTDIWLPFVTK